VWRVAVEQIRIFRLQHTDRGLCWHRSSARKSPCSCARGWARAALVAVVAIRVGARTGRRVRGAPDRPVCSHTLNTPRGALAGAFFDREDGAAVGVDLEYRARSVQQRALAAVVGGEADQKNRR
jgi:hypothetical protein